MVEHHRTISRVRNALYVAPVRCKTWVRIIQLRGRL
jgi:superfamily I DNA and RNA helicase